MLLAATIASMVAGCGPGSPDPTSVPEPAEAAETGDLEAFCHEARGLKEDGQRPEGDDERETPARRFTAMATVAPPSIRDDVEVVRALWVDAEANNVAVVIGGEDAAENIRPYSELMARHPNTREAGTRISEYVSKECGFFL